MKHDITRVINIIFIAFTVLMIIRNDFNLKRNEKIADKAAKTASQAAFSAMQSASNASTYAGRAQKKDSHNPDTPHFNVSQNAEVHAIGVRDSSNPDGKINIKVNQDGRPIILVLMAYEPITWNIKMEQGTIEGIILAGYHAQQITGITNVPIHAYTYETSPCKCYQPGQNFYYYDLKQKQTMVNSIFFRTGKLPMTFQYQYTGNEFKINYKTPKLDISDLEYIPR